MGVPGAMSNEPSKIFAQAHSTTSGLLAEVKKVCGADPEEILDKLASATEDNDSGLVDLHHEVLLDTQGVVKGHLHFIAGLQALSSALRDREHVRCMAAESVMEMFSVKCFCTIFAVLLSDCGTRVLALLLEEVSEELTDEVNQALALFVQCVVYAILAVLIVPPLQFYMAKRDTFGIYTRLHAAIALFTKGLPMILAWSMKDVLETLLQLTNGVFWDECVFTAVLILAVTALKHLPPVARAKAALTSRPPKDSVRNRYLNLPDHALLACGFGINRISRFLVEQLAYDSFSHLPSGARMILQVVFQIIYFTLMSIAVIRLDAWFSSTRKERQELEKVAELRHDWIVAAEMEIANSLGHTMTHALAFVYGWGVSDTLRSIYYDFFVGCASWKQCDYMHVWIFAILTTLVLGYGMQHLSVKEFRSDTSKSYRSLMTTAMSLTVGWAWMNVCDSTTGYFLSEWHQYDSGPWVAPVVYLFLFVFVYMLMVEVYWQLLDELRVTRRERKEFYEAYPLIPDVSTFATPSSSQTPLEDHKEKPDVEVSLPSKKDGKTRLSV